ncbi:chromatin structure-remodeling complex protein SYD-like isoform X3 [Amaranthus tricolor]|uniref:chromatin structure-remodeling complex protein SYD-like isoform X3 n=1 Tax=Amaranthus tricolor TaxID=29722 RepID=UPI002586562C|nr:chromatin structure-remodeling complex protein SYD-like isoform X3 [Amaranthus tricolor]
MADPHNVEFEAAQFLQKLIQDSKDEPAKLATKLYVILQHMKASGKENTMPYQVISRAMETVISQHGFDIEALMSSRVPLSSGSHVGESSRAQSAGCSQSLGVVTDSKTGMIENDTTKAGGFSSGWPPTTSNTGNDAFQGSISQRSAMSFDHESPSSMDTRSTNSFSQDRREAPGWEQQGIQKDSKRINIKRKRNDSSGLEGPDDITQKPESHSGMPDLRKERSTGGTFPADAESWKQGFATGFRERAVPAPPSSGIQVGVLSNFASASLDATGISHTPANVDRISQGGNPSNLCEMGIPGSSVARDTGKFSSNPVTVTSMPFKEHHLKQLRAQCLVFLAFRDGRPLNRLHLEIALGNIFPKEGTSSIVDGAQNDLLKDKKKQQSTLESSSISQLPLPQGSLANVKIDGAHSISAVNNRDADSKETENVKLMVGKPGVLANFSHADGELKHGPLGHGISEPNTECQETANSSSLMTASLQPVSLGMRSPVTHFHEDLQPGTVNYAASVIGVNKQLKPEMIRWTRVNPNDISRGLLPTPMHNELGSSKESPSILPQRDSNIQSLQHIDQVSNSWRSIQGADSGHHRAGSINDAGMLHRTALHDGNGASDNQTDSTIDGSKVVPVSNSSYMLKESSSLAPLDKPLELNEEEKLISASLTPSPTYTLTDKWIMAHQRRKLATENKWVQKLQKADERIATCFNDLKETVSSSANISAKTRSVIELKKLQLLELQRCLRRNILSDFFKPIQTDMDRLKSIKKHRIGRRLKHVEKYEQKMKEERQKRIRERQKEFFSEVEVHKERLEDVFKYKRERCKGFNRYVKEYHKRKERIHREKIDRIQREKINLLKINDVEGYLRMVQDAKSDRVKQLLKATEKYLLKLGSKLKQAKAAARQVEMDENRIATFDESYDILTETEDENDQAKHYKESNEKYYLIAHSIKESISEQPTGLRGGKLREYQMNGLRWLVSLYNNHLNGILADEMGLGKTVQVISLICYLMETKNDRGPFLVVVPSSVLPGWEHELSFWAPDINKIVYAGPPEERRRLFKDSIVHQKFNVLLTTYEYLMNKHDRPKLSKIHWHYVIIDEGHRIKNASCKLNADLKHYHSSHRLLLTGTPLQNNLEELWALLNFLLPNIFNSSEDFSQWFNKPFESNGDNSQDEQTLLSEEENLLIINRLHQVLRPFVLRRLKHKVENQLPEKIERLVRCEASAYQKLLMKRVGENLGSLGMSKARTVHNSVMELRNICNHPYLSQLHAEEVDSFIPKHFLPPIVRLCGKLEMLDRLLPKLKATNHRVLFFSTMTRLLDVMEEYLVWKQYRYLRLDGHTSGLERGALIDKFNQSDSPFFIFLLSIRAGGVGVNLQAADTVIIFDTDWNPQVDLQAQARAHRIGQKKEVLVLRLETVNTVEEQVRASAEHKLGVANQSITAGFFDNNTSAEDRREYLESLLRECKKEEAAPVLDDDSLNDILARSESEIDVFEAVDQKRREEEMATWKRLLLEKGVDCSDMMLSLPSRLVTDDDLKAFYEAMKVYDVTNDGAAYGSGLKRKSVSSGGFDTQQYGRGKRAREVRSYEEQWTEEEFEKMCQDESPETPKAKDENISLTSDTSRIAIKIEQQFQTLSAPPPVELTPVFKKEITPPVKRGRGRPRRTPVNVSPGVGVSPTTIGVSKPESQLKGMDSSAVILSGLDTLGTSVVTKDASGDNHQGGSVLSHSSKEVPPSVPPVNLAVLADTGCTSVDMRPKRHGRKGKPNEKNIDGNTGTESVRRRGRKPSRGLPPVPVNSCAQDSKPCEQPLKQLSLGVPASAGHSMVISSTCDPLAVSLGVDNPNSSQSFSISAVEDSKVSESEVKTVPHNGTHKSKSSALSRTHDAFVEESAAVSADATALDPKPDGQSIKEALLDSHTVTLTSSDPSTVSKCGSVSQDQVLSESFGGPVAATIVGIPPINSGTDLQKVAPQTVKPSSESVLPSPVGLRPGRRQSQKPQSGTEPARQRGRKRGRLVSTDAASPDVQDENLIEPFRSTKTLSSSSVLNAVAPSGSTNVEIVSLVETVPPVVQTIASTLSSTLPLNSISGSVHHVSMGTSSSIPASSLLNPLPIGTPLILSEATKMPAPLLTREQDKRAQAEETKPRRRGRKKRAASLADNPADQNLSSSLSYTGSGDFVGHKVITRSRQINIASANNSQEKAQNTSIALTSKNVEEKQSPKLCHVVVGLSNLGSASVKADRLTKALESSLTNPKEDTALYRNPVEIPPIPCKGKTNVVVLALGSTTLDVNPLEISYTSVDGKEECLKLQKDSARDGHALKVEVSEFEVSSSTDNPVANVDEELSAPPGFDTPRPGLPNSADRKSFPSDDVGTPKFKDAKEGYVVLALESTVQTSNHCSMASQNMYEKQKSSELQSVKDSRMDLSYSKLISCEPRLESVDTVTSQPEEEMSAPPGFDIPQRCLSDNADAMSLECVDRLASELPADPFESKVEHPSQVTPNASEKLENVASTQNGPHDGNPENDTVLLASNTLPSDFVLTPTPEKISRHDEPHNFYSGNDTVPTVSNAVGSDIVLTSLKSSSRDGEPSYDSDAVAASYLESKVKENSQGLGVDIKESEINVVPAASCLSGSDVATMSTSKSEEKQGCYGPDSDNVEHKILDAAPLSCVPNSLTGTDETSKANDEEECLGSFFLAGANNVTAEHDVTDATETMNVISSDIAPTLTSESKEDFPGSQGGNDGSGVNEVAIPLVLCSDSDLTSNNKEKEEIHMSENDYADKDFNGTRTVSHAVGSDAAVTPRSESEEKQEFCGPDAKVEHDMDSSPSSISPKIDDIADDKCLGCNGANAHEASDTPVVLHTVSLDNAATSLASKEMDEGHAPDNANAERDADSVEFSKLESEKKVECLGLEDGTVEHDTIDPSPGCSAGSDIQAISTLDLVREPCCHGLNKGDAKHEAADVDTAPHVGLKMEATSTLQLNETNEIHGSSRGDGIYEATDADTALLVGSDNVATSNLQLNDTKESHGPSGNDEKHGTADVDTALHVDFDIMETSTLQLNETKEFHGSSSGDGKHEAADVDRGAASDIVAKSTLQLNKAKEFHGSSIGDAKHEAADLDTALHVGSDITLQLNKTEESHGPSSGDGKQEAADVDTAPLVGSDIGDAKHEAADVDAALHVGSDITLQLNKTEESNEPSSGDVKQEAADVDTAPLVGSDIGDAKHEAADVDAALHVGSDITLQLNKTEESNEPSSGDVKQEAADVDTAPLVGSDIGDAKHEAADVDTALHVGSDITLQLNKTEESHGPSSGDGKQEAADVDTAPLVDSDIGEAIHEAADVDTALHVVSDITLQLNKTEESHGPSSGDGKQEAADVDTAPLVDSDIGDAKHEAADVDTALHVSSDITLQLNKTEDSHGPSSGDGKQEAADVDTTPLVDSDIGDAKHEAADVDAALHVSSDITLQLNKTEESHGPSSGDGKQEAADVDTAPLVDSDIGDAKHEAADVDTALHVSSDITLQLNKTEESHGPSSGDGKQEAADVDTAPLVDSDIGDAKHEAADVDTALHVSSDITLQLNKTEESHGPSSSDGKQEAADVDTAPLVGSDMDATSTSQLNLTNEFHGPISGDGKHEAVDVDTPLHVGSDIRSTLTLHANEARELNEPNGDDGKHDAVDDGMDQHVGSENVATLKPYSDDGKHKAADVDTALLVGSDIVVTSTLRLNETNDCTDTVATSTLQLNETNECNNAKLCAGDVCKESDAPAASIVESEDKEECYGSGDGNAKQNAGGPPMASGTDTPTASTLEIEDQKKSHGADCGNSELDAADPPIATISLRSDTLAASSLTLQEESDGSEDDNAKLCAGDVCKESDVPAASIIESEDKEECNGSGDGNAKQDASDSPMASGTDIPTASTLEKEDQKESHGQSENETPI